MKEEGIVGLSIAHKPSHGLDNIGTRRLHDWVGLVISQNDHILALIPVSLNQECRNVVNIIDATAQLAVLTEIVDSYEESLASTCTVGVLESVSIGSSMAKLLGH